MSWFDATGFANLAKSALKEAQKTIDKALDIKEEDGQPVIHTKPTSSNSSEDADFFDTWGVKNSENSRSNTSNDASTPSPSKAVAGRFTKDGPAGLSKMAMSTSLWGSFTGSFFDNPSTGEGSDLNPSTIAMQPRKSSSLGTESSPSLRKTSWEAAGAADAGASEEGGLCDDSSEFGFSRSTLVVESEDGDADARSRLSSCEADEDRGDFSVSRHSNLETVSLDEQDEAEDVSSVDVHVPLEVVRRRDHSTSSYKFNRLSVISSESDKRSSDSVEVLGYGSGFTTTPESPSYSGASSGFRVSVAASTPESVEVIPDTPSSVEVLGDHSSGRSSRIAGLSPYLSPMDPPDPPGSLSVSSRSDRTNLDLMSPESVEVIPEEEDDDEDRSMADDSYASASESTATGTITILEQPHFMLVKSDTVDSIKSLKSPHHKVYFAETPTKIGLANMMDSYNEKLHNEEPALTHANRAGLTLPLTQVTDLVNEGIDRLKVSESSNEDSMISDKTLVGIDSSYEGTISSDDTVGTAVAEDSSSDSAGTSRSRPQDGSMYVKTMLAEAMGEDESRTSKVEDSVAVRDHSPISSESRSDMVKIESEQTSGHTSGDEIETATSSDIEIISSPNGCDSSSTQSARHSPAKLLQQVARGKLMLAGDRSDSPGLDLLGKIGGKIKGHQRELSETSSGGSEDSHCSEVERLVRRISEMAEVLEARETKLIDLSRNNVELIETNNDLKSQLQSALLTHVGTQDVQQLNEEFTQRLSALERKFQQAVRDKEALRKQLDQSRTEAASRLSLGELEAVIREKDEVIEELRKEGGKLSRQELQHSNIIKKLRVKEREGDAAVARQKDQLEELGQEVERLKRSLAAKEEVERTQIEAVHQLTAKTKRQEKELAAVRSQLDDASQKMITLNTSLEAAAKELSACRLATASKDAELKEATLTTAQSVRQELGAALQEAKGAAEREQDQLVAQAQDLQDKLRQAQEEHSGRERQLRRECADVLRRLEEAEARNEELAQSVSVVTRPLLRQIEAVQAAHAAQRASWEKQERNLADTIGDLQGRLALLTEQERSAREQCVSLRSRTSALESRLGAASLEAARLREEGERLAAQCSQLGHDRDKDVLERESQLKATRDQLQELKREVAALEQQVSIERTATEAEKRKTSQLQEQLRDADRAGAGAGAVGRGSPTTPRSSPTLSFGRASLSDSISSAIWPQFQEDSFETGSTSGRYNVYDSLRSGNTTSMLEGLQSQLKLREGEVQQLQWDLGRRDAERAALTAELSSLTARVDEQAARLAQAAALDERYGEVRQRYDALLMMYGEKVEEAQELRLDLEDVKEVYKTQIDQLLKKESLQEV